MPLWQLGNYGESLQDIKDYILTDGIWNVSHQPDETIDALWQTILTGTDEEKVAAQQEINQYVIDQAWFVPMAYPDGFYALQPGHLHPDHVRLLGAAPAAARLPEELARRRAPAMLRTIVILLLRAVGCAAHRELLHLLHHLQRRDRDRPHASSVSARATSRWRRRRQSWGSIGP